ncbi:MAG: hypothetical protein JXI43_10670 [Tissierellales bacterium]|nr:hypothetical protein [Tissierellales bacterium]
MLTKTKYMSGVQCLKRLWLEYNRQDLMRHLSDSEQRIIEQGKEAGKLARKTFENGVLVSSDHKIALVQTNLNNSQIFKIVSLAA